MLEDVQAGVYLVSHSVMLFMLTAIVINIMHTRQFGFFIFFLNAIFVLCAKYGV